MSMRSTWIIVVLCAWSLFAFTAGVCSAQTKSGDDSSPKAPASPNSPTAPVVKNDVDKDRAKPVAPSLPKVDNASGSAAANAVDERMKRLADRFANDKPAASHGSFDATLDPTAPNERGKQSIGDSIPTASQKRASAKANQANQAKLVDPADLESIGPRQNAAGPAGESTQDFGPSGDWVLNLITALGVVLILVFLLRSSIVKWFSKAGATGTSPVVEVLTRVSVAPKNHVLLLRVGNRILIVGDSSAGLRTLGQVDNAEEVADILTLVASNSPSGASGGFRRLLQGFNGEYRAQDERMELGEDDDEFQVDRTRDRLAGLMGKLRSIGKGGDQ